MWDSWQFYFNAILLGVGLAMDACAVSMANGLNEPKMKLGKTTLIATAFGVFQALMPMIGWVCVHYVAEQLEVVNNIVPHIALVLLVFIGGKMLFEGIKHGRQHASQPAAQEQANTQETTAQPDGEQASTAMTDAPASDAAPRKTLTLWMLLTQAIATSIDALSVGFTIANYNVWETLFTVCVIALITFAISFGAVFVGKKFGTKLGNKAEILGGAILIAIGVEIFVTGVLL